MIKLITLGVVFCTFLSLSGARSAEDSNLAAFDQEYFKYFVEERALPRIVRDADRKNNNKKANRSQHKSKKLNRKKKSKKERKERRNKLEKKNKNKRGRKAKKGKRAKKGKKSHRRTKQNNKKTKKNNRRTRKNKKKAEKNRKNKNKNKKTNKKHNRNNAGKGQNRGKEVTTCASSECINNSIDYMTVVKDRIGNYIRQKKRIEKQLSIMGKKLAKKDVFAGPLRNLIAAAGGNKDAMVCGEMSSGDSVDMLNEIAVELRNCSTSIEASCDLPLVDSEMIAECMMKIDSFKTKVSECAAKAKQADPGACECWTDSSLADMKAGLAPCVLSADSRGVAASTRACIEAFSGCRKKEDMVGRFIFACQQGTQELKNELRILVQNKNAIKNVQSKIKSLATTERKVDSRSDECTNFINIINKLLTVIKNDPSDIQIPALSKQILEIAEMVVCTEDQKKSIAEFDASFDAVIIIMDDSIEKVQQAIKDVAGVTSSLEDITTTTSSSSDSSTMDGSGSSSDSSTMDGSGSSSDSSTMDGSGSSSDSSTMDGSGSSSDSSTMDGSGSSVNSTTMSAFESSMDGTDSSDNSTTMAGGDSSAMTSSTISNMEMSMDMNNTMSGNITETMMPGSEMNNTSMMLEMSTLPPSNMSVTMIDMTMLNSTMMNSTMTMSNLTMTNSTI